MCHIVSSADVRSHQISLETFACAEFCHLECQDLSMAGHPFGAFNEVCCFCFMFSAQSRSHRVALRAYSPVTHLFCIAAAAIDRLIRLRIVVPSNHVGSCIWVTLRAASVLATECCDRLEGAILCFYPSFFECTAPLGGFVQKASHQSHQSHQILGSVR